MTYPRLNPPPLPTSIEGSLLSNITNAEPWQEAHQINLITSLVSSVFHIPRDVFFDDQRGTAPQAFARQIAMYLLHISCSKSFSEVGRAFGRDRTTVSYACQLIEDKREDDDLDRSLELIECCLCCFFKYSAQDLANNGRGK